MTIFIITVDGYAMTAYKSFRQALLSAKGMVGNDQLIIEQPAVDEFGRYPVGGGVYVSEVAFYGSI